MTPDAPEYRASASGLQNSSDDYLVCFCSFIFSIMKQPLVYQINRKCLVQLQENNCLNRVLIYSMQRSDMT